MNILVVGGGSIGERHLRCFQQSGATLALCDTNEARRKEIAHRYQVESFATLDEAVARHWDAAVICTPAHLHIEHALRLLPSVRGLLIEKPLATRAEDVARLIEAQQNKPIQIAYVFRVHPAVLAVRELIARGLLGDLRAVTVEGGQNYPSFRPSYRQLYYARYETGGGCIQDAATHMVDLVSCVTQARFDWVFCDAANQVLDGVEVDDTAHMVGRLDGGRIMFSLAENQFMIPNQLRVSLHGSLGSAELKLPEGTYGLQRRGDHDWQWNGPVVGERDDLFRRQARAFLALLAGQGENSCSLDQALHTLHVNLAALESMRSRRCVNV